MATLKIEPLSVFWLRTSSCLASTPENVSVLVLAVLPGFCSVGKTTAAAQLIRDPDVGAFFERLLWVSVSADPDIGHLLRVLYFQLTSSKMPTMEQKRDAMQALREAAKGVHTLLVLDGAWAFC